MWKERRGKNILYTLWVETAIKAWLMVYARCRLHDSWLGTRWCETCKHLMHIIQIQPIAVAGAHLRQLQRACREMPIQFSLFASLSSMLSGYLPYTCSKWLRSLNSQTNKKTSLRILGLTKKINSEPKDQHILNPYVWMDLSEGTDRGHMPPHPLEILLFLVILLDTRLNYSGPQQDVCSSTYCMVHSLWNLHNSIRLNQQNLARTPPSKMLFFSCVSGWVCLICSRWYGVDFLFFRKEEYPRD